MVNRLEKFAEVFDEYFERSTSGYEMFADILSELANRDRPWQKTFIYNLLSGAKGFEISDQMWAALLSFEKEKSLAMRRHIVLSIYEIPAGSIVIGRPRRCGWHQCPEWFIPDHPGRVYHAKRCRMDARNERRRNRN